MLRSAVKDEEIEHNLLLQLKAEGKIIDSKAFADFNKIDHQRVIGIVKSLQSSDAVLGTLHSRSQWKLTSEGIRISLEGSPEYQVYRIVKENGGILPRNGILHELSEARHKDLSIENQFSSKTLIERSTPQVTASKTPLEQKLRSKSAGEITLDLAMCNGARSGMLKIAKQGGIAYICVGGDFPVDAVQQQCCSVKEGVELDDGQYNLLKKRQLAILEKEKYFSLEKGPNFSLVRTKEETDLTRAMLQSGSWKSSVFKSYNFEADGIRPATGALHPLMKIRQEYRELFLELGFQEMKTDDFVESSFWNFDALFVPQRHPARDMQDTFFLSEPESCPEQFPPDYVQSVRDAHESGKGCDSTGYSYQWSEKETRKNVLRTHTTAVTARKLYEIAQRALRTCQDPMPGKYFSIDRVFRNEEMDKTHLCEFHQVEGFIIDRNLSLAHMMSVLKQFFLKIGIGELRFKPAYNPYTEPSMEIFGYHKTHQKWVEVGNSGVFRPEMLRPMGFGPDVTAIAWGLSLERPTMIKYGIHNIHDLVGLKVDLGFIKRSPLCRM